MSKSAEYIQLVTCVVGFIFMLCYGASQLWIIGTVVALSFVFGYSFDRRARKSHQREHGRELDDPFLAEVLLDGCPVATISERIVTEMFWRTYRIAPLSPDHAAVIANDSLWEACRFTFRDPATLRVCRTGFVGGSPPFVQGGRISLRSLYFKSESAVTESKMP